MIVPRVLGERTRSLILHSGSTGPRSSAAKRNAYEGLAGELPGVGLGSLASALAKAASGNYVPVTVAKATEAAHGGLGDITSLWWDSFGDPFTGHDYYHDNAQSFLWLAKPGSRVTIFRDTGFFVPENPNDLKDHGNMILTTGDTCLAGIADFRPAPRHYRYELVTLPARARGR